MGKLELADDPRFQTLADRKANEDALEAIVEEWTAALEPSAVTETLQRAGVAAFPPMANYMLDADPHLAARDYWVEKEHQEVGGLKHAGIPWRMSETPCEVTRAAPTLGQDNEYVFGELLGMSGKQIAELTERQVIF
jgi:crotonobetainyl-CoA:carnitine CoA-transferase CaiB-like acyl-CoA transferase